MEKRKGHIVSGMFSATSGILLSRIAGLARDVIFAAYWGTGNALAGFLVAFTIPNLFRRLLGEGALSEGFVPMLTGKLTQDGKPDAFRLLNNTLSVVSMVLGAIVALGMVLCLVLQHLVSDELAVLTLRLAALLLPYTFFICLVGFLTGVLNVFGSFHLPFLMPVLLNVALIVGTIWLRPLLGEMEQQQIYALPVAVLVAGVVQLAVMWRLLGRHAYKAVWLPLWRSADMRELLGLILPGLAGAGIYQVNVLCDRLIAGWLGGYAVTSLYYSERLVYLPVGLFAVALSAVLLPSMSRAAAADDLSTMWESLVYSLRHILFLTLPCVLVLMVMGDSIISLIFERGSFDEESRSATLAALLFYAPGIPLFAGVKLLRNAFVSRKNTRTPMQVAAICMLANVGLNLVLMWFLQQRGLALATVLSAALNCLLLWRLIRRDEAEIGAYLAPLWRSLLRLLPALAAAAAVMLLVRGQWSPATGLALLDKALVVTYPIAFGGGIYLGLLALLGSAEVREVGQVLRSKLRRRS